MRTLAIALLVFVGCTDEDQPVSPPTPPPVPATIEVTPGSATLLALGDSVQLTATAKDQRGQVIPSVTVIWASGDTSAIAVGFIRAGSRRGQRNR